MAGFRRNLAHILPYTACPMWNAVESAVDRTIAGYEKCIFEVTEKEWRDNNYKPMRLYMDTPKNVYVFSEVCEATGKQRCNTNAF